MRRRRLKQLADVDTQGSVGPEMAAKPEDDLTVEVMEMARILVVDDAAFMRMRLKNVLAERRV